MVFATDTSRQPIPLPNAQSLVKDAAQKLMYSQDYKLIVASIRHKAYKLLNDSLPMETSPTTHGLLRAYAEVYKVLTNEELFDAAS